MIRLAIDEIHMKQVEGWLCVVHGCVMGDSIEQNVSYVWICKMRNYSME